MLNRIYKSGPIVPMDSLTEAMEELIHSDGRFVEWETLGLCVEVYYVCRYLSMRRYDMPAVRCTRLLSCVTAHLSHMKYRLTDTTQISALTQISRNSLGVRRGVGEI